MPRTTLDIDAPILRDLKRLQKQEGKSLGRLVSDLLAQALRQRKASRSQSPPFQWISRRMVARADLEDKEALWALLDRKSSPGPDAPARS
jgi:hypothetical protein